MTEEPTDRVSWTIDLGVAFIITIIGTMTVFFEIDWMVIRVVFSLPLVLLLPGYALVSLLFPEWDSRPTYTSLRNRPLGLFERILLGMIASVAIVPGAAYVLNFTRYGITLRPLVVCVAGITLILTTLAFVRRLQTPADERFTIPIPYRHVLCLSTEKSGQQTERGGQGPPFSPSFFNLIFLMSVFVLLASVAFTMGSPTTDNGFTELSILVEDDDGSLVAEDYPDHLDDPLINELRIVIENNEGHDIEYTLLILHQPIEHGEETVTIRDSEEINQLSIPVAEGERVIEPIQLDIDDGGHEHRVTFLLFIGEPPASVDPEDAYREVSLNLSG